MRNSLIIFVICIFGMWCGVPHVNAGLIVNEIMYDLPGTDTDHEWVEIYNDSSNPISLEGYKINDGANHGLNTPPVNGGVGSLTVSSGGYLVLSSNASQFKNDYPSFSGSVIDTVLSLANETDTISLVDSSNEVVDAVTYTKSQGGAGDGNSLGSFGSALFPGTPTPGRENTKTSVEPEITEEEIEIEKNEVVVKDETIPRFAGTITIGEPITQGVPVLFSTLIVNAERKVVLPGRYVWNFGDGTTFEYYNGSPFTHIYNDTGEYVVYFEYYKSKGTYTPDVVVRKVVSVTEGGVSVTSVGTLTDPKIEISNSTANDVDMSSWKIYSGGLQYVFPRNSILLRESKISIRPSVLGFVPKETVSLIHPSGVIASSMNYVVLKPSNVTSSIVKSSVSVLSTEKPNEAETDPKESGPIDPIETSTTSLAASAIDSVGNEKYPWTKSGVYYGLFILVTVCGIFVVGKIRKKSEPENQNTNDDEYDEDEFTLVE